MLMGQRKTYQGCYGKEDSKEHGDSSVFSDMTSLESQSNLGENAEVWREV